MTKERRKILMSSMKKKRKSKFLQILKLIVWFNSFHFNFRPLPLPKESDSEDENAGNDFRFFFFFFFFSLFFSFFLNLFFYVFANRSKWKARRWCSLWWGKQQERSWLKNSNNTFLNLLHVFQNLISFSRHFNDECASPWHTT